MQHPFSRFGYLLPAVFLLALGFSRASAHQQRMINADRTVAIRLGDGFIDLSVHLQYKEFPSLTERRSMDINLDGWIDEREAAAFVRAKSDSLLGALELTANDMPVPLEVLGEPKLELFGAARVVPLHLDLTVELSSRLELSEKEKSLLFRLNDRFDWPYAGRIIFALSADRSLAVDSTSLDGRGPGAGAEQLKNLWFSCRRRSEKEIDRASAEGEGLWRLVTYVRADKRPRFSAAQGDTAAAKLSVSSPADREDQRLRDLVLGYLKGDREDALPFWLLLAAAFLYGCLHALAPGHAKTITAAYLVGSRGTYSQALLLALTVTLTHTGSIILLAVVTGLVYGQALESTGQAVFSGISGLIVMVFGILRLRGRVHAPGGHLHHHEQEHPDHDHEHEPRAIPEHTADKKSRLGVLWLGFAGGLIPCPGALWIYLLALGFGRPVLGILLVLALSAGLALVLVAVGTVSIGLRNLIKVEQGRESVVEAKKMTAGPFGRLKNKGAAIVRLLPGLTGTLLIILGSFLLWRSLADLGWIG